MLTVSKLCLWDNSIKRIELARAKHNEVRRDNRALKNAGVKKYAPTTATPIWFLNINKTFPLKATTDKTRWNEWLANQTKLPDPKPIGRPRIADDLKKKQVRTTKRDKHIKLLLDNNIHLTEGKKYDPKYLVEYPEWELMPNGRLKHVGGDKVSTYQFLNNIATNTKIAN